jgi:hypothetical protein
MRPRELVVANTSSLPNQTTSMHELFCHKGTSRNVLHSRPHRRRVDSDEEEVSGFGWLGSLWGREGAGRIGDRRDRRIGRGKEGIRRGWDAWAFGALIGYRTRRVLYLMHCSSAPDGM